MTPLDKSGTEDLWQATQVAIQELCDAFATGEDPGTLYRRNQVVTARLEQLMEEQGKEVEMAAGMGWCCDG